MILYAHKGFTGTIKVAEEDGFIETQLGTLPYIKGDILFTDLHGDVNILTKDYLDKNFIEVKLFEDKAKSSGEEYRKLSRELGVIDY